MSFGLSTLRQPTEPEAPWQLGLVQESPGDDDDVGPEVQQGAGPWDAGDVPDAQCGHDVPRSPSRFEQHELPLVPSERSRCRTVCQLWVPGRLA